MSLIAKSTGTDALNAPLIPPMRNIVRKPTAKSIADENWIFPPHIVAIQLNIFTPVGTAMRNVMKLKNGR